MKCVHWLGVALALLPAGCKASGQLIRATASPSAVRTKQSRFPARIVSLTPNLTEILFALGAGERVVGVTQNDTYPAQVKSLPKVGGLEIDWEGLVRLKPDMTVLDSELNRDHLKRLEQLGLTVRGYRSQSLAGMREAVTGLAAELNQEPRGKTLLAELDRSLAEAQKRYQKWPRRPTVLVEIWGEPLMTAGGKTYVDEVIQAAGGQNVCSSWTNQYPTVSTEKLIELDPEVIVLITLDVEKARALPGWSRLRAVREGHLYRIGEDLMVRPTLRLPEAISLLQSWLEPIAMGQPEKTPGK